MSGGPAAGLLTSVEELRALVVELLEASAGLREVIAAKDHQITSSGAADRGVGAAAGCRFAGLQQATEFGFAVSQAGAALIMEVLGAPAG